MDFFILVDVPVIKLSSTWVPECRDSRQNQFWVSPSCCRGHLTGSHILRNQIKTARQKQQSGRQVNLPFSLYWKRKGAISSHKYKLDLCHFQDIQQFRKSNNKDTTIIINNGDWIYVCGCYRQWAQFLISAEQTVPNTNTYRWNRNSSDVVCGYFLAHLQWGSDLENHIISS